MKITNLLALGFGCAFVCSYPAIKANTIMDTLTNKQKVLLFYKLIVGQRNAGLIPEFVREDYIQHNPMVKQGRAGITDVINYLKTLPPPPAGAKSPIIRVIQEGDLVVTHLDIQFMGKRMAVVDLFKLKDGMLAEHWDVIQELPDQTRLAVTATNGNNEIDEQASAANSRHVADGFYKAIINKQYADNFIKLNYTEHDITVVGSGKNLAAYLNDQVNRDIKIHRTIAEGNFAVVQSQFKGAGKYFARYDLFRIEHDKIAEHWSVEQVIPDGVEAEKMF